jgi:DNA (cytosine-5)-methyltransferase 1
MLNGLDLFSGIGGIAIALKEWVRPIAYCEIDAYCQGVLLTHMSRLSLRSAPIWDDVRTLDGRGFHGVDYLIKLRDCAINIIEILRILVMLKAKKRSKS